MSYLVLARKWRPQSFEDVTGQEHVVRTLANAIAQNRLAHAFLLCGPRGVGKTTTARLLARAMNCKEGPTATPCGVCDPCQEIVAGTSVDVVEIDGASNNGVDSVRELRESARYMPQRDRHKVFIIDEVHMLSTAAFNALLKTLEEPPPHVKFVFATTDPQKLPETILSRVQRHNFRRVPAAKMVGRLRGICREEKIEISDHALELIARQADGGMRDALSLLDQLLASVGSEIDDRSAEEALGLVDRTVVHAVADALIDRDGKRLVEVLSGIHDRGIEPKRLCEELARHLRDLVYVQAIGAAPEGRGDAEASALAAQAERVDPVQLARLFDRVHAAIRELSFAAQPQLALEVALLSALHLAPAQGLAALAARLETVASSLGSGAAIPAAPAAPAARPMPAEARPPQRSAPPPAPPPRDRGGPSPAPAPRDRGGPPPSDVDDLIGRVEAMARARANPRQAGGRPQASGPMTPPPNDPDDEPGGEFSRVFPQEASPGGCATNECGEPLWDEPPARPAEVAQAVQAAEEKDDPTLGIHERWRRALDAIRRSDAILYRVLAEGRLLWLRTGEIALGYSPSNAFHRENLEGTDTRAQAEEALSDWFGARMRLRVQAASEDAPASVAAEEREERDQRRQRLRSEAREHPSVLAALSVLGGEIEEIQVLE